MIPIAGWYSGGAEALALATGNVTSRVAWFLEESNVIRMLNISPLISYCSHERCRFCLLTLDVFLRFLPLLSLEFMLFGKVEFCPWKQPRLAGTKY